MPTNDHAVLLNRAGGIEPMLQPQPFIIGLLAIVMLMTLCFGLFYALDRTEETGVRWIGGVLAMLSLGALVASLRAGLAP
jgi:hypothetical protein